VASVAQLPSPRSALTAKDWGLALHREVTSRRRTGAGVRSICHSGASTTSTGLRKTLLSAPTSVIRGMLAEMGRQVAVVLYVVA
jgi:hypothetical protein